MLNWLTRPTHPALAPLDSSHAARLSDIHAQAFARPWSPLDFERLLTDRAILADGLFVGREPCGFALSRQVLDEAEVLTVALDPAIRGRGHARPLLARHLDALAARRVRRVHLEVDEGNAPALALYRPFGFVETGRRAGYYLLPDGSRATAITMTAPL